MARRALDQLALDEAVREIVSWPPATSSWLKSLSNRRLEQTARDLLTLWGTVAFEPEALGDLQIEAEDDGEVTTLADRDLAAVVAINCLLFVDDMIREILRRGRDISPSEDWLARPIKQRRDQAAGDPDDVIAQLTSAYWAFLVATLGIPLTREIEPIEPYASAVFEMYSHSALGALNHLRDRLNETDSPWNTLLGEGALATALRLAWITYDRLHEHAHGVFKSGAALHPGPFSTMRPRELPALAARSSVMARRYGEKRVEKVFETQLSLIIQSLGFVVVQTRSGERRVDLLCIAGGPGAGFTFLVEAKTTAGTYSLTTSDERALAEYVRDVRRSLDTLPALRFVLLVGSSPAKTLASKLQRFEAENAVPTRFITASALANLREGIAGPVRPPVFETRMLASPSIVPEDAMGQLIDAQHETETAHTALVRTLLSKSDWPNEAQTASAGRSTRLRSGRKTT